MSVLVTGGAGYIGSHMVLQLIERGEDVVVLDNLSTGFRWAVPPQARFIEGDMGDEALLDRLLAGRTIDAIIHFAAKIVVPESVSDPLGYYLNNCVKARALIAAAVRHHIKHFIFSSTAAVYGAPQRSPVHEDDPKQPINPYGHSKRMVEIILDDVAKAHDLRFVALRYFNVAGADPHGRSGQSTPAATHLIKVAVQAALGQRAGLDIFGVDYETKDGTCVRDYIHVTDLISAHARALDYLRGGGAPLFCNVGYGRGYSVREVINVVKAVSGVDFKVREVGRRPGDPAALVADQKRIRDVLGWHGAYDDLALIVRHALDWERHLLARSTLQQE
jgi:UDP-glucose 4-epimerase